MKNLFTNLMKNTAKRTQNTGGGTSREKNSAVAVWNDSRTTVKADGGQTCDGQSQRRFNVSLWKYAAMLLMLLCLGTGEMWGKTNIVWDFTTNDFISGTWSNSSGTLNTALATDGTTQLKYKASGSGDKFNSNQLQTNGKTTYSSNVLDKAFFTLPNSLSGAALIKISYGTNNANPIEIRDQTNAKTYPGIDTITGVATSTTYYFDTLTYTKGTSYYLVMLSGKSYFTQIAWIPIDSISFDATTNGGTCSTTLKRVANGNQIGTLPTPTKEGNTFDGWYTTASGEGTQITTTTVINANATYYARFSSSCSEPTSPSISGTTSYTAGDDIELTASATGTDGSTTYQWYKGDPEDDGVSQGDASTDGATFAISGCEVADAGTYYCVISNGAGCEVTTYQAITVDKADMPSTGLATGTATSITASGATLPFTMTSISGVGSLTIKVYTSSDDKVAKTISNVTAATSGSQAVTGLSASTTYYYTITPIGDANHNDGDETSASSTFTTDDPACSAPTSPSISGTTSYTAGDDIELTASATGTDGSTTYQWYKGDPADSGVSQGDASTDGATFTIAGCEVADAGTYYCVISNGAGCDVKTYQAITVAKASMPSTGLATGTATSITTSGATLPFTMTSTSGVGSLTIKVYDDNDDVVKTVTNITPATSGSQAVTGLSAGTTYYYTITPIGDANHNDGSETSASSTFTTLTVTYTVTYAGNSPTSGSAPTDSNSPYSAGATVAVLGNVGTPSILTKSGYTFRGWSYNGTFYKAGDTFTISENTTLTAVWDGAGSSVTLTHFGTQFRTSAPRRGFAYAGSLSGTKYIIESDDSNTKNADNDSSAIRLNYSGKYLKVLGPGATTTLSDSLFTGVTQVSFKWQLFNATTSTTTNVDVYVGGNKVGSGIELTGTKSDPFAPKTISIASKNGGVKIVNTGTGNSSKNLYFDDITITCGVLPTGKSVTFACGSTEPSTSVSGMPSKIEGVTSGLKIVKPADPSASGYIFGGWYSNAACTSSFSFSGTITKDTTIYAKWTAKTQPTQYTVGGDTYYCPDETAEITLSGSQSGVSYQLKKGGSAQGDAKAGTGEALSWTGMTAGTYTISAVENATYAARDMSGSVTVSAAATTAISSGPTTSVSAGASVNFTLGSDMVTAGHGLSHQWYSYSSSGGADEAAVDGAESATYTTSKSAGTYYYKVKVSGDCGDPVYSNMITVTVKTAPTVYELSGSAASICDEVTLTLDGSDDGVSYQLYKGGDAEGDPKAGDGEEIEWTVTSAGTYTVKTVETSTYAEATMDGTIVIEAMTETSITTQPTTSVSGHDGVNFTLGSDLDATGEGTLTYQWYSYSNSGGDNETTVGSATTTKALTTSKSAGTYYYKVKVIGECGDEKSNMITVTIDNKHLLTYNANGGEGAPDAEFRAAGSAALSATEPTRDGYRFLGWNTEDDGTGDHYAAGASYTMGSSAVTLHAEWGETATLTWSPNVNTAESSIGTADKGSTNARIDKDDDMANITNYGSLTITSSAKDNLTSKIETPTTYNSGKYLYVTFDVPEDYEFVPTSISVKVQPVGSGEDKYTILDISDENSHNIRSTATKCDGTKEGKLTTVTLEGDETALTGTVTLKIYVYNYSGESTTNNCYRLGSPITIAGNVNYVCPERPTITSPTSAQAIKLYTDRSKTLSIEAEAYAGTLNYQWQKDGADIDGATSASYTVDGSGLTAGITYVYTCNVSETEPASCATVTSPAFNITAASPDCGVNTYASVTLTSGTTATTVNATALANAGAKDSGDPAGCYKLLSDGKYFGIQLTGDDVFQEGDKLVFRMYTKATFVYLFNTENCGSLTTSDAVWSKTDLTTSQTIDLEIPITAAMATSLNTNKKAVIYRNSTNFNQNHCFWDVKLKRYTCPDIYVYDDASGDGLWSEEDNWIGAGGHGSGLPTIDDRIVINKPMTVDVPHAKAKEIILDQSGNTGKLTIEPNMGLEVAGTITRNTSESTGLATRSADLILESSSAGNASLIFNNNNECQATVQMYSKAEAPNGDTWKWQYAAAPAAVSALYNYYGGYLYKWNDGWNSVSGSDNMELFAGYCVSYPTAGHTFAIEGELAQTEDEVALTIPAGKEWVVGNSWTAPIQIKQMTEDDFENVVAEIHLFNTGMDNEDEGVVAGSAHEAAGSYRVVTPATAGTGGLPAVISSLQGFYVANSTGLAGTLKLDYAKHVRPSGGNTPVNGPMLAPRRVKTSTEAELLKIVATGSRYCSDVMLFAREDFSYGYDICWDGRNINEPGVGPLIYTLREDGTRDAISAIPEYEGAVVGFVAGEDSEYTFRFTYDGADIWYLNDTKLGQSTLISNENTYTFTVTGDDATRFVISKTSYNAPSVTTGVGNQVPSTKARKLMIDGILYIIREGRIYNAEGAMVK